jgi:hypothetical protein
MYCCKDENLQFKEHFGSSWSERLGLRTEETPLRLIWTRKKR